MNLTDSNRRVDKGVTVGNCRMDCLVFEDELVAYCMRGSSQQGLQLAFDRFFCCMRPRRNENQFWKIEVLCLLRRPRQCFLQVSGNTLHQVETYKYLGMEFTSDESRNKGIDTRICKANAVLRELYCSVVTKRELLKNTKLSVFKSVFVPILTYGN